MGLAEGATDRTKLRYGFAYGDLCRIHRSRPIACMYRPAESRDKAVERASYRLLQHVDLISGWILPADDG